MASTVLAAGDSYEQDEAQADVDVDPGELVELTGAQTLAPHGTAAATGVEPYFARDHPETGRTLADTYPAGDEVKYIRPAPGARVRARIAAGNTLVAANDVELISAGDGTLRPRAGDGTEADADTVATLYEDVDTSDGTVGVAQVRVQ